MVRKQQGHSQPWASTLYTPIFWCLLASLLCATQPPA
jgi:hypothetical protein